jgi:diguanylate cyclase (GGDEF)-like protein
MTSLLKNRLRSFAPVVVALLAACVALVGGLLGFTHASSAGDAASRELDARASSLERSVSDALASGSSERRTLERAGKSAGAELAVRRASAGERRQGGDSVKALSRSDSGDRRIYTYLLEDGRRVLEVAMPAASIADARRGALLEAALATLVAMALGGVLAALLVRRRVTGPLTDLAQHVERLADGAKDEDARVSGSPEVQSLASSVNDLATAFVELRAQASTDPLTGVANRRSFHAALEAEIKRAERHKAPMALVVVDLDGFKEINDTNGHPFGDGILRIMAERLRATMRATDVLARVGGDEFAMILPGMDRERAATVVERAREVTAQTVGEGELTWCAGIACYPRDARDSATLLGCSDAALYCAKTSGPPVAHYDPKAEQGPPSEGARTAVAALLAKADSVVPVFQPLVSLTTGQVSGFEALARFPDPPARRPDQWFELAHRAGLGPALEARAVEAALSCPGRPAGTYLSFNLSPPAIISPEVAAVLPHDLSDFVVEITEHEQIADAVSLHEHLDDFRSRGARIAIDDAGAGYSGLQQVMRVAPDLIKLDRSLVANVDKDAAKAALIDSFVRFGRRTGAAVCAEGIETAEELKLLTDLDVDYGQGFGLARPGPPWATVASWVAGTVRVRRMSGGGDGAGGSDAQQNSDIRLADVVARLGATTTREELCLLAPLVAGELRADEVTVLACSGEDTVEALLSSAMMPAGDRLAISNYAALGMVLSSGDPMTVLHSDGGVDPGTLALIGAGDHGSVLIVPIVLAGRPAGMLVCLSRAERHWSHSETSRARIVAQSLGPVLDALNQKPALHTAAPPGPPALAVLPTPADGLTA